MLTGALFWCFSANIVGRKFAFNWSIMICNVFTVVTGASLYWIILGLFVCFFTFGGGGNLVLDTAILSEFSPRQRINSS